MHVIKSLMSLPSDLSLCEYCNKRKSTKSLLIWREQNSYNVDGLYLCDSCFVYYKSMGYDVGNIMPWVTYMFVNKKNSRGYV